MGAKHNLPSLENVIMDSPDREHFDGGVGGVVGKKITFGLNGSFLVTCVCI